MSQESNRFDFLNVPADQAAPRLLGCLLERELNGQIIQVKIVETEAYDQSDPASHSFRGITPGNRPMFGPAGFLYVYFTYGMHFCCNISVDKAGYGAGALIRAVEPMTGLGIIKQNRGDKPDKDLTNGPGKICQALSIDKSLTGHDLHLLPLKLIPQPAIPKDQIIQTTRIGISQAQEKPWRFYIKNNPNVSKPRHS